MADTNEEDTGAMVDEEIAAPPEQAREEAQEETAEGSKTMEVAGVTLDETQLPLFIVLVASIVLLIATTTFYDEIQEVEGGVSYDTSFKSYAISISSIAMILSFVALVLTKVKRDLYEKFGKYMNMLNFVYSFIGACFLTFDKPFTSTGNGYFAAWALVFGSAMTVGMTANAFGSTIKGLGALMGLLASSIVVIVATISPLKDNDYKSEAIYAIVVACVTATFILFQMTLEKKDKALTGMPYFGVMAILAICWILEACFVTFRGPFVETGNGYFASWAGAATSTMAAFAAKNAM